MELCTAHNRNRAKTFIAVLHRVVMIYLESCVKDLLIFITGYVQMIESVLLSFTDVFSHNLSFLQHVCEESLVIVLPLLVEWSSCIVTYISFLTAAVHISGK
jgi:hypothetical protein